MALVYRLGYVNSHIIRHITKPVRWTNGRHYAVRYLSSDVFYENCTGTKPFVCGMNIGGLSNARQYSTQENVEPPEKQGVIQRLKAMYRDYWYVVLPVHVVTSAMWFGGFYYIVSSGIDVLGFLEWTGLSEKILAPLRDSSAGFVALTLACYKVISPLRYAVTLGVTTFTIRRLQLLGYIKPVPSKARLKEMYQEKKENFQGAKQHYQDQFKDKRNNLLLEMRRYKQEMKNKVKKM